MKKIRIFSGNTLKIIAAISMLIDHLGYMIFPDLVILRIIGRIAFPIYAFMIAEGAKYTRNKLRYFLMIFILGFVCQVVYYFFDNHSLYMSILITFSISILLIYLLQFIKWLIFNTKSKLVVKILVPVILIPLSIIGLYYLNQYIEIDYGFWGILCPVLASLFDFRKFNVPKWLKKLDNYYIRLIPFFIGQICLMIFIGSFQWGWILSIPFLFLYSEKRGKWKMKYFFYIFYPLHLVILEGILLLIQSL